ncbi:MAG: hypothetical protein M1822_000517 [Bathelium mastoideum]|nr:MAG: hypothetical protein M1822_000517 [Bathelium mastoideum]
MAMENNPIQLLGGFTPQPQRRAGDDDTLAQLFRPNKRFERGYSNAPSTAPSSTHDPPPPAYAPPEGLKLHKKKSLLLRKNTRIEKPPEYSCTNLHEGELDLKTELVTPFKMAKEHNWSPVYVVLRGPLLCMHRRAPHIITSEAQAGRLLKSYTLQNAEAGLADDCLRVELEPLNARARMVLPRNRWEAYSKDKSMFQKVKYYILRLRVEEEQILLSTYSKTRAMAWLEALCSAMDIAPDIDERIDPRSFTETRNRARRMAGHLMRNRWLVMEQERLFREHYPQFAEGRPEPSPLPPAIDNVLATDTAPGAPAAEDEDDDEDQPDEANEDPENEEATAQQQYPDWLNSSTLSSRLSRLDPLSPNTPRTETRPPLPSHPTPSAPELTTLLPPSILHLRQTVSAPPPTADLDPDTHKWRPQHPWTLRHDVLYRRRCLPVLVANAPRTSDVIVKDGKRLRIDWDKQVLIPLDAPRAPLKSDDDEDENDVNARFSGGDSRRLEGDREGGTRSTSMGAALRWRKRQQSPPVDANSAITASRTEGSAKDASNVHQDWRGRAATSSGSDLKERSREEGDERANARTVSEGAAPTVCTAGGSRRPMRMLGGLFRSKTAVTGGHNRVASMSSIPEPVEEAREVVRPKAFGYH